MRSARLCIRPVWLTWLHRDMVCNRDGQWARNQAPGLQFGLQFTRVEASSPGYACLA